MCMLWFLLYFSIVSHHWHSGSWSRPTTGSARVEGHSLFKRAEGERVGGAGLGRDLEFVTGGGDSLGVHEDPVARFARGYASG
jgi:hypothetical protein